MVILAQSTPVPCWSVSLKYVLWWGGLTPRRRRFRMVGIVWIFCVFVRVSWKNKALFLVCSRAGIHGVACGSSPWCTSVSREELLYYLHRLVTACVWHIFAFCDQGPVLFSEASAVEGEVEGGRLRRLNRKYVWIHNTLSSHRTVLFFS